MKLALALLLLPSLALAGPLGGKPAITRGPKYIVDFDWKMATQNEGYTGVGGATAHTLFDGCSADLEAPPRVGDQRIDEESQLAVEILAVQPGKSGRGDEGHTCTFRISDPQRADRYVELLPVAFNTLSGLIRQGDVVYAQLTWNGYAKEVHGKGNFVAAYDLAKHTQLWRSPDMTSNAQILVDGDWLVTGYGFTAEPHFLVVYDRMTGAVSKKVTLPKSPEDLHVAPGELVVRLYDGWARFSWKP